MKPLHQHNKDDTPSEEEHLLKRRAGDRRLKAQRQTGKKLRLVSHHLVYRNKQEESTGAPASLPNAPRIGIGHLFTTGPNPARDQIIHVAGIRFSNEEPPRAKDWILNPGRSITRRLYQKSRVSTAICQEQPSWLEMGPQEITPFFEDLDVLFVVNTDHQHEWFRRVVLKKTKRQPVCIDLYEMAQFFLPGQTFLDADPLIAQTPSEKTWKKSDPRLPYLVNSFGFVLQDILSTILFKPHAAYKYHLVYSFLERALASDDAPSGYRWLLQMAAQAHRIQWSTDLFARAYDAPHAFAVGALSAKTLTREIRVFLPEEKISSPEHTPQVRRKNPLLHPTESVQQVGPTNTTIAQKPIKPEDIDPAFDKLAKDIATIHPRPSQRDFARFCTEAINKGGVYAIEAGTGTGKTLGYLVPACEFVRRNPGRQIVIVTATKNLQNQVVEQELPKLTTGKTLYQGLQGSVLKGKANYLCITALTDLFEEVYTSHTTQAENRLAWLYLFMVLIRKGGELEGIPRSLRQRFPALEDFLEEANAQTACVAGLCRMGLGCVYPQRLHQARNADIVVTNQHKLAFLDDPLRERSSVCLIDEADHFPENLRSAIKVELSDYRLRRRFLNRLVGFKRRRGFAQILDERFKKDQEYAEEAEDHQALETCHSSIQSILAECEAVRVLLGDIDTVCKKPPYGDFRWVKLPPGAGARFQEHLRRLAQHFDRIAHRWDMMLQSGRYRILERGNPETRKRRVLLREKTRIAKYLALTLELKRDAEALADDYPSEEYIHVYANQKKGWALQKIPFNIADALETVLFRPFATTIFTSATLFVDDRLDLFTDELCREHPFDGTLRLASPFDYAKNVLGVVTTFIRPFRWDAPPAVKKKWKAEVVEAIAALSVALYGRTLVLFTNALEMKDIYRQVRPLLEKHDIESLLQNGSSLAEIDAFRATEHSVLFGVDRFWTGVDFPGPTLSQVIVVRLPNPNLSDPLIQHRLAVQGEAFWERYYRPVTGLKLKQGFGRLIRSENDRGLFVVLDQRLMEDPRMRRLQRELPIPLQAYAGRSAEESSQDLMLLATQGLKRLNLYAEFTERGIDLLKL